MYFHGFLANKKRGYQQKSADWLESFSLGIIGGPFEWKVLSS